MLFTHPWASSLDHLGLVTLNKRQHEIIKCENFKSLPSCDSYFISSLVQRTHLKDSITMIPRKYPGECKVDMIDGHGNYLGKTLHIISECNTLIGVDHQKKFHILLFPNSSIVIIKESGHLMFTEKTKESLKAIREFLSSDSEQILNNIERSLS